MIFGIFISIRGIHIIFGSTKVSQTAATRSRHVSQSGSVVLIFFFFTYLHKWRGAPFLVLSCLTSSGIREQRGALLFAQRRESAGKLIIADRSFYSFFCRFVLSFLLSFCFIVPFVVFSLLVLSFCFLNVVHFVILSCPFGAKVE